MIDPSTFDVTALHRQYFIANTPAFLFRRFRADLSVQRLAQECSTAELLDAFERLAAISEAERSSEDVARIYAILVALAITDLDMLRVCPAVVDWHDDLIAIAEGAQRPVTFLSINSAPGQHFLRQPSAGNDSGLILPANFRDGDEQ